MASAWALAAVCALLGVALLLLRRLQGGPVPRRLAVIETARLGPQGVLCVVRAGERCFLIASTASAVSRVAELDMREWQAEAVGKGEADGEGKAWSNRARTAVLGGS